MQRRIWQAIPWAVRSPSSLRFSPGPRPSLTLIASAGLGAEIDGEYIEGFISSTRRKEIKPLLDKLFADPTSGHPATGRGCTEVQAARRREPGAARRSRRRPSTEGVQQHELSGPAGGTRAAQSGDLGRRRPDHPGRACEGLPGDIRVHVLDGNGHMVQMEAASEVNRLLNDFLGG